MLEFFIPYVALVLKKRVFTLRKVTFFDQKIILFFFLHDLEKLFQNLKQNILHLCKFYQFLRDFARVFPHLVEKNAKIIEKSYLSQSENTFFRTNATSLDHNKVLFNQTIMRKSSHGIDRFICQVIIGGSIVLHELKFKKKIIIYKGLFIKDIFSSF